MAHKYEHISTGDGFKVKNGSTVIKVIDQDANRVLYGGGGYSYPIVAPNADSSAVTTNTTLASADFGKNLNNTGAGAAVTLTLPAASTVEGKSLRIKVETTSAVRLDPATGEKVYLAGNGVASKYLDIAGVVGNYADIYCDGDDYFVTGYSGVLTKEA